MQIVNKDITASIDPKILKRFLRDAGSLNNRPSKCARHFICTSLSFPVWYQVLTLFKVATLSPEGEYRKFIPTETKIFNFCRKLCFHIKI